MKKKRFIQFSEVFKIIKKNFYLLITVALLSIAASLINISLIQIEKSLVDAGVKKDFNLFISILKIALIVISIKIPLEYIKAYVHGKFSEKSLKDLREEISKKLIVSEINLIEKNTTGDFISRLTSDLSIINGFLTQSLNDILYHPVVFVIGIVYGILVSWQMTLFCFAVIPIVILAALYISKPVEKFTKRQQDLVGETNTTVQDVVTGALLIKAFLLEAHIFKTFKSGLEKVFHQGLKIAKISAILETVKGVIQVAPSILLFLFGGYMVIKNKLTFGGLIAFAELMNIFLAPMHILPNVINNYRKTKAAALRINEILLHPNEMSGDLNQSKDDYDYAVEFENVIFSYDRSMKPVLEGVSFKIKKGEKVAIVGPSGSGKSTIVKLLLGLYRAQSGQIKILGNSLEEWNLKNLRDRISVVNQDIFLFPTTIYENILYGKLDAKREEIEEACRIANIHDFIINEAGGYFKEIGERGVNLSGGQKQRITIARAILKNSDIFILDEATSALDIESENALQSEIEKIVNGKTVIIIAHRFSTIKNVHKIIVIDNGKICEEGTHKELIEKKGVYYNLYSRQFADKMEGNLFT
ncbi:ABC transporter related protein [Caldicellulosiruptor kronotskyensis 2002]|uniref:ABC transporter related protein n=1 Tax=Caldicellulosiruptor kronotskyensis (strain DSM 18902 / VKM B-2412 / 2002) TaxID=632348 RepID=E4SHD8_CALK2|nr:ABC transporter ATP-binding protein [Caldicellulosiruptor kronotskyensis]ADQ47163.1 ABC transporter related protein [Caldicellulosiruptor kronotskyensis 2002]